MNMNALAKIKKNNNINNNKKTPIILKKYDSIKIIIHYLTNVNETK